ncbi:MAG: amidohydrolase family protein [Gemmatimonadota bacterium]
MRRTAPPIFTMTVLLRGILLLLAAFALSTAPGAGQAKPDTSATLVFNHVAVIDAEGLRPDQTVSIRGDRILDVAYSKGAVTAPGARVIDARGRYLIPGLWDMHAHLTFFGSERLPLFLINGVTGVRDLGGIPDSIFLWRKIIARGGLLGPRIVAAGLSLSGPDPSGRTAPHIAVVRTAEEAQAAVRRNKQLGADMIKVWSTIPRDAYFAALAEARRLGLPVVGHLPVDVSLTEAVDSGQKGFEHSIGFPIAMSREQAGALTRLRQAVHQMPPGGSLVQAMIDADVSALGSYDSVEAKAAIGRLASHGVWICPTLTDTHAYTIMKDSLPGDPRLRYLPEAVRKQWVEEAKAMKPAEIAAWTALFPAALRLVGEMRKGRVTLIAGTDAGSTYDLPGFDLHNELALLVRAGLSPLEALTAGTKSAAEAAGLWDRAGMIKAGQLADLVLLDANPLADITNTRRIVGVTAAGRYLDKAELERLRARLLEAR